MPVVVPIPLGGLGKEIGTLTDQLLDIEQHRLGAATDFVATLNVAAGSGWVAPPGTPSVSAAINATGACLILAGQGTNSGNGMQMGVSIDGALPPTIKGEQNFASSQVVWVQQGLSMGVHTFTVVENAPPSNSTTADVFIVVIPV